MKSPSTCRMPVNTTMPSSMRLIVTQRHAINGAMRPYWVSSCQRPQERFRGDDPVCLLTLISRDKSRIRSSVQSHVSCGNNPSAFAGCPYRQETSPIMSDNPESHRAAPPTCRLSISLEKTSLNGTVSVISLSQQDAKHAKRDTDGNVSISKFQAISMI